MTWRFIVFIESRNSCLFGIKKLIICTHNLVLITAALIIKINKWHPYQIPCGAKINHQSLAVLHSQCVIKKIHGKFVSKLQGILFIFSEKKISKNHSKSKLSLRAVDISKEFEMRLYSPRFNIPSALEGLHFQYLFKVQCCLRELYLSSHYWSYDGNASYFLGTRFFFIIAFDEACKGHRRSHKLSVF